MSIFALYQNKRCPTLGFTQHPKRGYFKTIATCYPVQKGPQGDTGIQGPQGDTGVPGGGGAGDTVCLYYNAFDMSRDNVKTPDEDLTSGDLYSSGMGNNKVTRNVTGWGVRYSGVNQPKSAVGIAFCVPLNLDNTQSIAIDVFYWVSRRTGGVNSGNVRWIAEYANVTHAQTVTSPAGGTLTTSTSGDQAVTEPALNTQTTMYKQSFTLVGSTFTPGDWGTLFLRRTAPTGGNEYAFNVTLTDVCLCYTRT